MHQAFQNVLTELETSSIARKMVLYDLSEKGSARIQK